MIILNSRLFTCHSCLVADNGQSCTHFEQTLFSLKKITLTHKRVSGSQSKDLHNSDETVNGFFSMFIPATSPKFQTVFKVSDYLDHVIFFHNYLEVDSGKSIGSHVYVLDPKTPTRYKIYLDSGSRHFSLDADVSSHDVNDLVNGFGASATSGNIPNPLVLCPVEKVKKAKHPLINIPLSISEFDYIDGLLKKSHLHPIYGVEDPRGLEGFPPKKRRRVLREDHHFIIGTSTTESIDAVDNFEKELEATEQFMKQFLRDFEKAETARKSN